MPFICDAPGCGKSFATRRRLFLHRAGAHHLYSQTPAAIRWRAMRGRYVPAEPLSDSARSASPRETFRCRECGVRFRLASDRKQHVRRFHRDPAVEPSAHCGASPEVCAPLHCGARKEMSHV